MIDSKKADWGKIIKLIIGFTAFKISFFFHAKIAFYLFNCYVLLSFCLKSNPWADIVFSEKICTFTALNLVCYSK